VFRVDVADGHKPRAGIPEVAPAHAADADDGLGQFIAGRSKAPAAENTAGDDGEGGGDERRPLDELAPADRFQLQSFSFCFSG
jgi:hypothetical protein